MSIRARFSKFLVSDTAFVDQSIILNRYRTIMAMIGVLYPAWRFLAYYIERDTAESWEQRGLVGILFLFFTLLTYTREHFRKYVAFYFSAIVYLWFVQVFYLMWVNNMSLNYVLLTCVTVFCIGGAFLNHQAMLGYFLLCIAFSGANAYKNQDPISLVFLGGVVVALSISFVCSRSLLRIFSDLHKSQKALAKRNLEFEELSAAVQSMFLPDKLALQEAGFDLAGYYRPATACGGDWLSFYKSDQDTLCVFVGDVTGHGPGSAMMTASVAAYLKALQTTWIGAKVPALMEELNRYLLDLQKNRKGGTEYLMTMLGMEISLKDKTVKCYSAGTPFPFVVRKGAKPRLIGETGSPLGMQAELALGFEELKLEATDRIFIYTDGIIEMKIRGDKPLGERRLLKLIQEVEDVKPVAASKQIEKSLDQMRHLLQEDDFTFLIIDVA